MIPTIAKSLAKQLPVVAGPRQGGADHLVFVDPAENGGKFFSRKRSGPLDQGPQSRQYRGAAGAERDVEQMIRGVDFWATCVIEITVEQQHRGALSTVSGSLRN
jgi:hypothetical protein